MKPTPILFLGDAPDQQSGLGRIGRDLATLLTRSPYFRVGYLGLGFTGSRQFPFTCYAMQLDEWGIRSLPRVWKDFAGNEKGVVFTIWDMSRLLWLTRPKWIEDDGLREFYLHAPFRVWSYVPVDSVGPGDRLTLMTREALLGVDRLLAYTPFGENTIVRTIGAEAAQAKELTWLPHALDGGMWRTSSPRHVYTPNTREHAVVAPTPDSVGEVLAAAAPPVTVGVVATNQARKDYGLMAAVCFELKRALPAVKFWWHVDVDVRHWSIPALIADYGLGDVVEVTHVLDDAELAARYRACDVTLAPGSEGFGYPIFESLLCGVPCLHGDYAGGASILASCGLSELLVAPACYRMETEHNCVRAVYRIEDWVGAALALLAREPQPERWHASVEHLQWAKIWPRWRRWFEEGLR